MAANFLESWTKLRNDQEFISKYLACSFSTEENVVVDENLDLYVEGEKNCRSENYIALERDDDFCSTYLCTSSKPMDNEDYVGIENLLQQGVCIRVLPV